MSPAEQLLQRHFGFSELRPLQARVLAALDAERDVLAVLPTGAGKSVCFQLPALLRVLPTIVVSPLISLMQDQVGAARARGVPAAALNSSLSPTEQRAVLDDLAAGRVKLIYASPERLPRLAEELASRGIRPGLLAVDEAHCIAEWGWDFRPAYRGLRRLRARLGWPRAIALTGSATPEVRTEICRSLGLGSPGGVTTVLASFDRRNLWFGVRRVGSERERLSALLDAIALQTAITIVYAPTRNLTEELARVIQEAGHPAVGYHAGLRASLRRKVLERFLADEIRVIVATSAFGMGIDKPNVRLVVHWSLPPTPESYYQEAGRAGRDGAPARCLLLYRPGDAAQQRRQLEITFPNEAFAERVWRGEVAVGRIPANQQASLERLMRELRPGSGQVNWEPVRARKRAAEARLEVMDRYAREGRCRRRALIGYFGEELPRCSGCDVCHRAGPRPEGSRTLDARVARLRRSLAHLESPWGGGVLEPGVLRALALDPPASAEALAAVPGVGPVLVERYGRTMLAALAEAAT